ncbi:hypothetical protein L873DRAFT_297960, partial [Choiromyces venosus 120613-1]
MMDILLTGCYFHVSSHLQNLCKILIYLQQVQQLCSYADILKAITQALLLWPSIVDTISFIWIMDLLLFSYFQSYERKALGLVVLPKSM